MAKQRRPMREGELEFDPSPEWACVLVKDEGTGLGRVSSWVAFDPRYGPETEAQIEYWQRRGYPGADTWEVGKKVKVYSPKQALASMQRAQELAAAA